VKRTAVSEDAIVPMGREERDGRLESVILLLQSYRVTLLRKRGGRLGLLACDAVN
jgi:hypothetical protein